MRVSYRWNFIKAYRLTGQEDKNRKAISKSLEGGGSVAVNGVQGALGNRHADLQMKKN